MSRRVDGSFGWTALSIVAAIGLAGCSSKGSPSAQSGATASSSDLSQGSTAQGPSLSALSQAQIQNLNQKYNTAPSYTLTSADVALLKNKGLLTGGDPPALAPLVKK